MAVGNPGDSLQRPLPVLVQLLPWRRDLYFKCQDSGPCLKLKHNLHQGLAAHRENLGGPKETGCPEQLCWAVLTVVTREPPG